MCIRAGSNELESMKNLMGMSLMAVIAEALQTDIDAVAESSHLVRDLQMDSAGKRQLEALIAEVFDGLQLNLDTTPTVAALLDRVVLSEFADDGIRQYVGLDLPSLSSSAA
jgi:acyl carrier protein